MWTVLGLMSLALGAEPTLPVLRDAGAAPYPRGALERAVEAEVRLTLIVAEDGRVVSAELAPEQPEGPYRARFEAAARGAAYGLRFEPARDADGEPVAAEISYLWAFRLAELAPLSIDGEVREQGSRRRAAGARIDAAGPDDATALTFTDDEGGFRFADLAPGEWLLTVRGPGLIPGTSRVVVPEGDYVDGVRLLVEPRTDWEDAEVDDVIEVIGRVDDAVVRRGVDREEILVLPGSLGDPVRAIQNLPGLSRPPFGSGQLLVRGTNPTDTAYFVDGLQVPLVFHFTAVSTVVAASIVDEVDFYPGNYGTRYGRAVGGVVDLTLDESLPSRSTTELGVDIFQAAAFARYRLSESSGLMIGVRRSYIDAVLNPLLPGLGLEGVRAPRFYDAQLHVFRKTAGRGRVGLFAMLSDDQFRILGESSAVPLLQYRTSFQKVRGRWHRELLSGQLRVDTALMVGPEVQELELVAPADGVGGDLGLQDGLLGGLPPAGSVRDEAVPWTFRHEWTHPIGESGVGARVGVELVGGGRRFVDTFDPDTVAAPRRRVFIPAFYAEDQVRVGHMTVMTGLRVESFGLDGQRRGIVEPRTRATLDLDGTKVFVAIGRYSQPPSVRSSFTPEAFLLAHERSWQRTIGVSRAVGRLTVEASGYHSAITDRIVGREQLFRFDEASLTTGDDISPFDNDGAAWSYGLELLAKWRSDRTLLWGAATLGRSWQRTRYQEVLPGRYDQPVNLTAIASQDLGRRWRAGFRARYVSGLPREVVDGSLYLFDTDEYLPITSGAIARLNPFFALDLRVDKEVLLPFMRLNLYLELQNATNQRNVEVVSYSEDFRREEEVVGLPILPAFGFKGAW